MSGRKNPENKPLRIVRTHPSIADLSTYGIALSNLAIAESNLVKAGKSSGLPHFLVIVKELEHIYGFEFRIEESPGAVPQLD